LWAWEQWALRKHQRENDINPQSKLGKEQWQAFEDHQAQRGQTNPDWGVEWKISRATIIDRFNLFGIGRGTDAESRAWGEFLGIASDYLYDLGSTYNKTTKKNGVGPRSQTAGKKVDKYLGQVAALANRNPDWWKAFQDTFTMSKFGFYWHSANPDFNFLFGSATGPTAAPETAEEDWDAIWQEELEVW
jgi:hypothetical protein